MPGWLAELLRKEWFLGALGGVVATVIGFLLAIMWDIYKIRTEGQERTQVAMTAIAEELAANKKLKTGFWDVAKVNLSRSALPPGQLVKLRHALSLAEQANEEIRSRETYRLHNNAMSNFHDHLALYNGALLKTLCAPR